MAIKEDAKRFVWVKKIERDLERGISLDNFSSKAEKKRKRERIADIEKLKRRKDARAIEKARREEEREQLDRERARAEFQDLEKQEEEFIFRQAKIRSKIRSLQGRLKPIDVLINQLDPSDGDLKIGIEESYMVFKGLKLQELEELGDQIKLLLDLDRENIRYWEALLVVWDWELAEARKIESDIEEIGMHSEVTNILQGRTYDELEDEQSRIESKMASGEAKLRVFKAKALLKKIHTQTLLQKRTLLDDHDRSDSQENDQEAGSYSPELLRGEDSEVAIDPEVDRAILEKERKAVLSQDSNSISKALLTEHDKFQPRQPKYFNRVHTSYEWNKYNATHYDHENPPPKTVQGYKFDIFYPDLIDKSKAPTYSIEKDGDSEETCIIRFHGGLPYEDVAFRIVGKEWEYSKKKGFKCTFERGTLHLYFNFKRYRYRR